MNILRVFTLLLLLTPTLVLAHSGRTDSSGGHNCNTGACAGSYHYHNGGSSSGSSGGTKAPAAVAAPIAAPITQPKMYSESQYNSIVSEKSSLGEQVATLTAALAVLEGEKEASKDTEEQLRVAEEEVKRLKNEETYVKLTDDLEASKNEVADLTQKTETLASDTASDDEGGGLLEFLLGGGAVYGWQRLYRRKEKKNEGVMIKGNVRKDGKKIYYTPDNKYYDMVRLDSSKGERWFETEQEAQDAGWVKVS